VTVAPSSVNWMAGASLMVYRLSLLVHGCPIDLIHCRMQGRLGPDNNHSLPARLHLHRHSARNNRGRAYLTGSTYV